MIRKTIIIDNLKESFQLQPGNGIKIRDWYGTDLNDKELYNLIPFLKQLAKDQTTDIRTDLKKCNNCTTFINGAMTQFTFKQKAKPSSGIMMNEFKID